MFLSSVQIDSPVISLTFREFLSTNLFTLAVSVCVL